jgi:hypothetical protein
MKSTKSKKVREERKSLPHFFMLFKSFMVK